MGVSYGPISLNFPERDDWVLSKVLKLRADEQPNKVFLSQPGVSEYTYAEIDRAASQVAAGLHVLGLRKGDRILLYLENRAEYVLSWFGASRAGIVEVPTNTDYFGEYLDHCLTLTSPSAIVTSTRYIGNLVDSLRRLALSEVTVILVGEDVAVDLQTLKDLDIPAIRFADLLRADPSKVSATDLRRQDLGAIIFTSGTTGPSKGVMMSHSQLHFFAEETIDLVRLTDTDVYMTANPMFHGNAQFVTVYPALIAGASVALYEKFSPAKWIDRIRESRAETVTNFLGVMMEWICQEPVVEGELDNKLRCIFAAPTAFNLVEPFTTRFGPKVFVEGYGQTETCIPIMTPHGMDRPQGSAGLLVGDWFEIRLADDETDDEVPPSQVGEIQIRTKEPWILNSGYFGMPEATAAARRNLWYHTGDGARLDPDGWYYFVDRLKDTIRRRGENISSFQIEQVFLRHPAIAECAAIGVPADEEAGEDEIEVWLVPNGNTTVDPEELVDWATEQLPRFVVPRYVQIADRLPTTPSGKVQKAKLRSSGVEGAWDRMKGIPKEDPTYRLNPVE